MSDKSTSRVIPLCRSTRENDMTIPLARMDVSKDAPQERIKIVSEAIYNAVVEIANPIADEV
jgi:hypothetical protein